MQLSQSHTQKNKNHLKHNPDIFVESKTGRPKNKAKTGITKNKAKTSTHNTHTKDY